MIDLIVKDKYNLKNELLSGLTVALALVPEAVAFAFVAGVDPKVGLWAAFFVGFITSAIGGRPGMISGATGAMAVVMTSFVILYGLEYLFAAVILCGVIQIACGVFKLGKFVRLLPHPVMLGFVNGLAIVIGKAQFGQLTQNARVVFDDHTGNFGVASDWISGTTLYTTIGLIVLTMAIIQFLPKLTKIIPGTLAAIIAVTMLVQFTPLNSVTVSDFVTQQKDIALEKRIKTAEFEAMKPGLLLGEVAEKGRAKAAEPFVAPEEFDTTGRKAGSFKIPRIPLTFESFIIILGLAITLAAIGLIESLMTLTLIDEITETRGHGNRECIGQGLANMVSGLFGSMGGCAMIGQSMINIRSGGRSRISGMSAALFLLCFIIFPPLWVSIGKIPVAALIGVMFIVVIATFEWTSLRLFGKVPKSDLFVIVVVSATTVVFDLAIAVISGVIISAIVFAWQKSRNISAKTSEVDGVKTYELNGPLFFGSVTHFKSIFTPNEDPDDVVIEFKECRVYDHSAIEAIHSISEKYRSVGKIARLKHLSKECQALLTKAGDIIEIDLHEDPDYHIASNELA